MQKTSILSFFFVALEFIPQVQTGVEKIEFTNSQTIESKYLA